MARKGIVLAGGSGTRLHPLTLVQCKQLLPVYDKPMVYYPISVIMLAGIRDILIISTPRDIVQFEKLLGDGREFGVRFSYAVQPKPQGIAQALIIGEAFLQGDPVTLILGDNIFHGDAIGRRLMTASERNDGATIFAYFVHDPARYGIVELDNNGKPISIVEKPDDPKSNLAVTGLYLYDNTAVDIAHTLKPSARGEIEITDLNKVYLDRGALNVETFSRGFAWLDAGTPDALLDASNYIAAVERRQQQKIACLEEIAWRQGWIDTAQLSYLGELRPGNFGRYLKNLAERH